MDLRLGWGVGGVNEIIYSSISRKKQDTILEIINHKNLTPRHTTLEVLSGLIGEFNRESKGKLSVGLIGRYIQDR